MAITLGASTRLDDGVLTGTFKTLNVTATLAIVPIEKTSDKAPDHRIYAGPRRRGRRRLKPGREVERRDLHQPQNRVPGFWPDLGPLPPRQA